MIKDNDVAGHVPQALASTKQGTGIIRHFFTKKGSKGQVQVVGKAVNRGGGYGIENTMRVQVYWTAKKRGYAQKDT